MSLLENIGQDDETIYVEKVTEWLNRYGIEGYEIKNRKINVDGNVYLWNIHIIPDYIQFGKITGDFYFTNNTCYNLRGCPEEVDGLFSISNSRYIKSLQYAPKKAGMFYASRCQKKFTKEEILEICEVEGSIVV